jgi:hypothetical protein
MLSVGEEEEIKKKAVLQKKRERDATKMHIKKVRGPREKDQVGEDFPQPSNRRFILQKQMHPTPQARQKVEFYKSGLHPSDKIRQILQKRQITWQMEQQAWAQGRGVFQNTIITQSMRFKVLIKLNPTLKDKEDWYKKIYVGCFNNK